MQDEGEVLKVLKEICYQLRIANKLKAMEVSLIPLKLEDLLGMEDAINWALGIAKSIILPSV